MTARRWLGKEMNGDEGRSSKPEQSKVFGKDDEGRSNEDLVSCLENSNQYGEMMHEAWNKAIEPYGDLCMFVGFGEGRPLKFVTEVKESEQYLNFVSKKEETPRYREIHLKNPHTQLRK